MTNEEFQTFMISEVKKIHQRFDTIDSKFEAIETRLDTTDAMLHAIETRLDTTDARLHAIETRLDTTDARLHSIEIRLDAADTRLDTIETRLSTMDAKIDQIESQQRENTDFIQALLHQTEELNAKYDGLLNITVSSESFAKLEKKIDIIAYRIIDHDTDLSLLRRAK